MNGPKIIQFYFSNEIIDAYDGETIAGALIRNNHRSFRQTTRFSKPRGMFCGIGVCFDCSVWIEGHGRERACVTRVRPGMKILPVDPPVDFEDK
jgi:predicted molibdopterin-dependent oxidoreductase YjgC